MMIAFSASLEERAWRSAYLRTLRDLRISVLRRRPMSLPNLLRLYQRRVADLPGAQWKLGEGIDRLRSLYFRFQPFTEPVFGINEGWSVVFAQSVRGGGKKI